MVYTAPCVWSPSKYLWYTLSNLQFNGLRALTLDGWELGETDLAVFLAAHQYSLTDVSFKRCDLHGEWRKVLGYLNNLHDICQLVLHHVSERSYYITYPRLGTPFISPETDLEGWAKITRNNTRFEINVWDPWRRSIEAAQNDMRRSRVRVCV